MKVGTAISMLNVEEKPDSAIYQDDLRLGDLAEPLGFDSIWSVEHHFLEEFSHCSNPEVIYSAIAARTSKLRIGYGVRLTPKPYNHPVRTAESVAVLDLISNGRVEFGTGRSATRLELEGFLEILQGFLRAVVLVEGAAQIEVCRS